MSLTNTMLIFLALQSMVTLASAEVALRYGLWYLRTGKGEKLLLRSLIGGIAVTHAALFVNTLVWTLTQIDHNGALPGSGDLQSVYTSLIPIRVVLFVGVTIHMLPLWRIIHRFSVGEIIVHFAGRVAAALVLIYVGLALDVLAL